MPARLIAASLTLLVLGCARPATESPDQPQPPPATTPSAGTPTLPWPDAATCAAAARTPAGDPSIDQAIRTIVGGKHSPDHIGPEPYAAIEGHLQREPDAFLDAWARTALDPATRIDLYWSNVLTRTATTRPERTRELAACLLARIDAALAHPPADRDPSWEDRVRQLGREPYVLWRGRPDDGTWRLAMPSRGCTTATDGVTTLTVQVDCTCGEPVACDVAAGPDRLDAFVTIDPTAPPVCDDCYAATGTCTLPASPNDRRPLTLNGLGMPVPPCPR